MAIYLLIAGTYTPVCLIALRGAWGWTILSLEWLMAGVGIATVLLGKGLSDLWRAVLYGMMGWLAIIAAGPVLTHLSTPGILWLIGGGVVYSVGAAVFVLDRPNLWPGRFPPMTFGIAWCWPAAAVILSSCSASFHKWVANQMQ